MRRPSLLAFAVVLLAPGAGRADDDPLAGGADPEAAAGAPGATFSALENRELLARRGRRVVLGLRGGGEVRGVLVDFDGLTLRVAFPPDGKQETIARRYVEWLGDLPALAESDVPSELKPPEGGAKGGGGSGASWPRLLYPKAFSDDELRALTGRWVRLRTVDRLEVRGRLLSFDAGAVVIGADDAAGALYPRARIAALRAATAPDWADWPEGDPDVAPGRPTIGTRQIPVDPDAEGAGSRPRHIGVFGGVLPSFGVDVASGLLYGFANLNLFTTVYHALVLRSNIPASIGAGLSLPFGRSWSFDVMAVYGTASFSGYLNDGQAYTYVPVTYFHLPGLAVGVHATFASGLTIAMKAPLFGLARGHPLGTGSANTIPFFYVHALEALPLFSLGYRF